MAAAAVRLLHASTGHCHARHTHFGEPSGPTAVLCRHSASIPPATPPPRKRVSPLPRFSHPSCKLSHLSTRQVATRPHAETALADVETAVALAPVAASEGTAPGVSATSAAAPAVVMAAAPAAGGAIKGAGESGSSWATTPLIGVLIAVVCGLVWGANAQGALAQLGWRMRQADCHSASRLAGDVPCDEDEAADMNAARDYALLSPDKQ